MTGDDVKAASGIEPEAIIETAKGAVQADGLKAQIFKAISVQRPVVLDYLGSLRRDRPEATPAELLKELDKRYVATVTAASTGVGASAAIPGVGIPVALGMGVADLLFFYETSALYVLAVAELHGVEVQDDARAQPLVFGTLLGEKSQSEVRKVVIAAVPGLAAVDTARTSAAGALGQALPKGWGPVLTEQLPDSALAPVLTVLARQALKQGGKLSARTLGKAVPFGFGAVIGGVGSFTFGRDVVKAARIAFPETPVAFPPGLIEIPERSTARGERPRAVAALQAAAGGVRGAAAKATEAFRSVDLDGDGVPDEARALTAAKGAGAALKGAAAGAAGAVGGRLRRKRGAQASALESDMAEGAATLEDAADLENAAEPEEGTVAGTSS